MRGSLQRGMSRRADEDAKRPFFIVSAQTLAAARNSATMRFCLAAGRVEGAGVVDDVVAARDFGGVGELRGEAQAGVAFGGGALFGRDVRRENAGEEALDLEVVGRGDEDDAIEALTPVGDGAPGFGFEDESRLDDDDGVRVASEDFVGEALLLGDDGRVDDAIELVEAALGESKGREAGAVQEPSERRTEEPSVRRCGGRLPGRGSSSRAR